MHLGDLSRYALFLDLDGTLIDIAPTPDQVTIPVGIADLVSAVRQRLDGAVAILTGRPVADVDRYLAPLRLVAAGVHGAEIRTSPEATIERRAEPVDDAVVEEVRHLAAQIPGTHVELKLASLALHYRLVPESEQRIEAALLRILAAGPDNLILCRGRKVLEIVPRDVSKGGALASLMRLPTFHGRRPVMIGDDISDMSAFEMAVRLGGLGLKVAGEQFPLAEADFAGPAEVRAWLEALTRRHAP